MADWKVVLAELAAFEAKREVVKAIRRDIRKPAKPIGAKIKARAVGTLPRRGGLNRWVSSIKISTSVAVGARKVGLKLKGGRNSLSAGKSDVRAIDEGKVRHPSWGRRGRGQWHAQPVTPEFFTGPARDAADEVERVTTEAVDRAFDLIRKG